MAYFCPLCAHPSHCYEVTAMPDVNAAIMRNYCRRCQTQTETTVLGELFGTPKGMC